MLKSTLLKFSSLFVFVAVCATDVSKTAKPITVSQICLGCICQATSGCKLDATCEGDSCGLFRITYAYWADAGNITVNGDAPDSLQAYTHCVDDARCAALTVQGYMQRFAQDCNGDGEVNCRDFMAIHEKGGYGCSGDLPPQYESDFNQCIATVAAFYNLPSQIGSSCVCA